MTRFCAGLAVVALVLTAASASAKRGPVLAFVWNGSVVSLTRRAARRLCGRRGPGCVARAGCDGRCFHIVDPASGAMVASAQTLRPTQLVAG